MPVSGQWAVDIHPNRDQIIQAMAAGTALLEIRRTLCPNISRDALGRYRKQIVAPGMNVALQLSDPKRLSEVPGKEGHALRQVSASEPILAALRADRERRDTWIDKAEVGPDGMDHHALIGHDRNNLSQHRLHAELTGALSKEQVGPVTNIMIVATAPQDAASPHQAEVVDVQDLAPPPDE